MLKRNDQIHDLETLILGLVTSRIVRSAWVGGPTDRPLVMTVFAFRRHKLHLPAFDLRLAKVAELLRDNGVDSTRVELSEKPRFAERYVLHAGLAADLGRFFNDDVVNALEREPSWCLEGLGEWCIAYRYHQIFWTLRAGGFEDCTGSDQLSARLKTAEHLFGLMIAGLSR